MRPKRIALSAALLPFLTTSLLAQLPPHPRPAPTIPVGPREPRPPAPGQFTLPDPCQDFSNQPLITLTLSPSEIYREDAITATWDVRDRRVGVPGAPGVQWAYPVHIEASSAQPAFADPAPRASSHTYSTPAVSGHVTVKTRCGEKRVNWERIPDAFLESVAPVRGPVGMHVILHGSQFGGQKLASRVEIVRGNQTWTMETSNWGNVSIEAIVPNMPVGPATIRVVKGGRRTTLARDFRVVKSITLDNAAVGAALASLAIPPAFVHFSDGSNASSVTLPAAVTGGDPPFTFTLVALEVDIPAGEKIAQSILMPGTGFPMKIRYQANDLNSNAVTASVAGGQLVLAVGFEGGGSEIKGRVRYCDVGAFGACASASWKDSLAPDIQIDSARVTFRLTPGLTAGQLSFSQAQFAFDADIQIGSDFANWLVPKLRAWANELKETAGNRIAQRLNTASVRRAIATALMGRLRAVDPSLSSILSITPSGNSIVVEYE